ncbi:hypothetical protein [Roseibium sp.]|uniref:hypothetical protein n=1 Tax=Roseibium sp. TaxID=1936156 RepID=UPI003A978D65
MKTILLSGAFIAIAGAALAGPFTLPPFGTEDVPAGVLCQVKDVTVLAQSAEDCTKIGGAATHTVTTVKTPVK